MIALIYVRTNSGRPAAQKWFTEPRAESEYWGKKGGMIVAQFPLSEAEGALDLDLLDKRYRHRVSNTEVE